MVSKEEKRLKEQTKKLSIKEGSFAVVRSSLADSYIVPYAIALNASNFLIGLLSSLSGIIGPFGQLVGSRLIEKYPRKKIIIYSILFECLAWVPIILLGIFYYLGIFLNQIPWFLIFFFTLYIFLANLSGPAWFSWMGDIVDKKERGSWFAKRNYILGIITIIITLIASFVLDFFKKNNLVIAAFMTLFFIGISARMISREYFKKSYEPKLNLSHEYYFSFTQFLKKAPFNNFGRYTLFMSFFMFSVSIASPFFSIYMLKDLGFSYTLFMIITLSQSFFGIIFMGFWGKFADKYGNRFLIKILFVMISIFPFFWLFSSNPLFLILVPSFIAGVSWAGFSLASSNYIYDAVTPQRRGLVLSYFNIIVGFGVFLGAGFGSFIVEYSRFSFINNIFLVFIISGLLRFFSGFLMIIFIREIRETEKFDSQRIIKELPFKAFQMIESVYQSIYEFVFKRNGK